MSKSIIRSGFAFAIMFSFSVDASSELIDRGNGFLYDKELNVTWLRDANYAQTVGKSVDGRLDWYTATSWVASLSYRGVTGWRLPVVNPDSNTDWGYAGTDVGYNVKTQNSELAHLFYVTLGNKAIFDINGNYPQPGWDNINTGLFINFQLDKNGFNYWTGTTQALYPPGAWDFSFLGGQQNNGSSKLAPQYLLILKDGNIGVPEPETNALFICGFFFIGYAIRKRRREIVMPSSQA